MFAVPYALHTVSQPPHRTRGSATRASLRAAFYRRSSATNLLFVAPALVLFCAFIVLPVLSVLDLGFYKWDGLAGPRTFVGLANFHDVLFADPIFWVTLRNTAIYLLVGSAPCIVIGFILACSLRKSGFVGRILRSVVFLPYVVPAVVVGSIWAWILQPDFGTLNSFLTQIGHPEWAWSGWAAPVWPCLWQAWSLPGRASASPLWSIWPASDRSRRDLRGDAPRRHRADPPDVSPCCFPCWRVRR